MRYSISAPCWSRSRCDRRTAPAGERSSWRARFLALRGTATVLGLFFVVIGGMYGGVFTPTEAAGIGAVGAFFIALARRKLTVKRLIAILADTAATTTMLFFVLVGALIFSKFITIAGFTQALTGWFTGLDIGPLGLILIICVMYLVLGCFLESMSMILLTLPIIFPIVMAAGFDPIWFGVIMVTLIEVALITPPVGMNVYMMHTLLPHIPMKTIFAGVGSFVAADIIRIILLIAFPAIATFLPSLM